MLGRGPPPPPVAASPPTPVLVLCSYAVWLVYLLYARKGKCMKSPSRLDRLWVCWPVALGTFLLAEYELNSLPVSSRRDLGDPIKALVFALPITGFGLLLLSEGLTCEQRREAARLPARAPCSRAYALLAPGDTVGSSACSASRAFSPTRATR